MRQRMTTAEVRLDQGSEASNSTIWLPTRLVVAEFSCSAPQRDRKLPSTDRESGECRSSAVGDATGSPILNSHKRFKFA